MRLVGFVAQIVAGNLLLAEEFGAYAVTVVLSSIAAASNSTLRALLIERLASGDDAAPTWARALVASAVVSIVAFTFAPQFSRLVSNPAAETPLRIVALSVIPTIAAAYPAAVLAQRLAFADESRRLLVAAVGRHGLTIGLLLMGFRAEALAWAVLFDAVVRFALLAHRAGRHVWSVRGAFTSRRALAVTALAGLAQAAAMGGDYLVLAPVVEPDVLGRYFFAFTLTAAATQPITSATTSVLVGSFAKLADRPDRATAVAQDAMVVSVLATSVVFGVFAVVVEPLLHLVWGGRWGDGTAVAAIALSLGLPFRLLGDVAIARHQAGGAFGRASVLIALNAISLVVGAAFGSVIGGAAAIGVAVAVGFVVYGAIAVLVSGGSLGGILLAVIPGYAGAAAGLTFSVREVGVEQGALGLTVFALVATSIMLLVGQGSLARAKSLLGRA